MDAQTAGGNASASGFDPPPDCDRSPGGASPESSLVDVSRGDARTVGLLSRGSVGRDVGGELTTGSVSRWCTSSQTTRGFCESSPTARARLPCSLIRSLRNGSGAPTTVTVVAPHPMLSTAPS